MEYYDQNYFQPFLQPSEKAIWVGRPPKGILFRKTDIFLIPFSLLWGGFAIFWEIVAYTSGGPAFFLMFGGFFVLIGLYIMFGRFFLDAYQRKNTIYVLTNERAMIIYGGINKQVKSINFKNLPELTLELKSNGMGTITFGSNGFSRFNVSNSSWPGTRNVAMPSFEMIENVQEVYNLIQSLQREKEEQRI